MRTWHQFLEAQQKTDPTAITQLLKDIGTWITNNAHTREKFPLDFVRRFVDFDYDSQDLVIQTMQSWYRNFEMERDYYAQHQLSLTGHTDGKPSEHLTATRRMNRVASAIQMFQYNPTELLKKR